MSNPHLVPLADVLLPVHHDVLDTLAKPDPQTVDQIMDDTGRREGQTLRALHLLKRHGLACVRALQLTHDGKDECFAATTRGRQMLATLTDLGRHPGA